MVVYKAFDFELRDRQGNKYEFNKWYFDSKNDYMAPHKECGFHCCINPWDTLVYFKNIRVVKVEVKDYKILEKSGSRLDSIVIAKNIKLLEDVEMNLKAYANSYINWEYVSNHLRLTNEELEEYINYIDFKRYNRGFTTHVMFSKKD